MSFRSFSVNVWDPLVFQEYKATFLARLERRSARDGDCHRWTGAHNGTGYGNIKIGGRDKIVLVHRLSAAIHFDGFCLYSPEQVNHKNVCRYRDCWEPNHLYVGNQSQNMQDAIRRGSFWSILRTRPT